MLRGFTLRHKPDPLTPAQEQAMLNVLKQARQYSRS
jgi:hypothetical protein